MTLLAATLLALATCAAPVDRSLVGLWESEARSAGGIGNVIELRPDGSFVATIAVTVDFAYRLDKDRLFSADDEAALRNETESTRLQMQGDAMVVTGADGTTLRKERLGAVEDPKRPLLGAWRHRHYTGAMAFERYTAGGQLFFRLPMNSNPGCYALDAKTLTLAYAELPRATFTTRIAGDDLELRAPGVEIRYRRVPAWYPRDTIDYQPPKQN